MNHSIGATATAQRLSHRERFLRVVRGERVDRPPVSPLLMFLAADRAGMTYRRYATDGNALAAAQLCVQERYGLDAITACSDAFRVSADLGGEMGYPENHPPHLLQPLVRGPADVARLHRPDPTEGRSRMGDRVEAVAAMVRGCRQECAVLGWIDMPFAEACSLCGVQQFMTMLVDDPNTAHRLLSHLTKVVVDFALAQLERGADMVGAGDAAASLVSPKMYRHFALPYEQRVCAAIHDAGGLVKMHVCGNTARLLDDMATSGADLFNVDHMVPLALAAEIYSGHGKSFKGNLDPVRDVMAATPDECYRKAAAAVAETKGKCYMLSAGCEIPAATPDEVMDALCAAARAAVFPL